MTKRIAIVGAGALGGYVGGTLAHLGHDVTLIDPWPEHVEIIRSRGLELDGMTPEERFTVRKAKILHITEVQSLAKTPIDVAMVSMKSYDTAWATHLIAPYLSPQGYIVSLQNCLNEETIAGIVGWGRVVGVVASLISVDLYEAGRIRRTVHKGGDKYTIFRVGEPHGRITSRIEELAEWFRGIDSSKTTSNLWGERWSKLCQNGMGNGATDGDPEALAAVEGMLIPKPGSNPRADIQRPSMAQDIIKGRRTEIEQMNGLIARKGAEIGVPAPSHAKLTELVTKVERGELKPSPSHLGG